MSLYVQNAWGCGPRQNSGWKFKNKQTNVKCTNGKPGLHPTLSHTFPTNASNLSFACDSCTWGSDAICWSWWGLGVIMDVSPIAGVLGFRGFLLTNVACLICSLPGCFILSEVILTHLKHLINMWSRGQQSSRSEDEPWLSLDRGSILVVDGFYVFFYWWSEGGAWVNIRNVCFMIWTFSKLCLIQIKFM